MKKRPNIQVKITGNQTELIGSFKKKKQEYFQYESQLPLKFWVAAVIFYSSINCNST